MGQEQNRQQRAVVYLRVARAEDGSDDAIAAQRAACERIAITYGATIVREYVDRGKSARLTQQTELRHLLADLEQRHDAAYVVVWDYARLGRDLQSLDDVIRRIRDYGAEVATPTGVTAAERFTSGDLLDRVAEWAKEPPGSGGARATESRRHEPNDDLNAAVETIRRGRLNADQCESLATLVSIAGNATLPTPVAAAVFNAVEACTRTIRAKETTNE
jgi:hypothetical protein